MRLASTLVALMWIGLAGSVSVSLMSAAVGHISRILDE